MAVIRAPLTFFWLPLPSSEVDWDEKNPRNRGRERMFDVLRDKIAVNNMPSSEEGQGDCCTSSLKCLLYLLCRSRFVRNF